MTSGQIFKLICLLGYCLLIGGLTLYAASNSGGGPHTKVVQAIEEGHLMMESDLRSIDAGSIAGRYAKHHINSGSSITGFDVTTAPVLKPSTALAVVVAAGNDRPDHAGWNGAQVQICDGSQSVGEVTTVLSSVCDEATCLLTIPLDPWPKDFQGLVPKAKLTVVSGGSPCKPIVPIVKK